MSDASPTPATPQSPNQPDVPTTADSPDAFACAAPADMWRDFLFSAGLLESMLDTTLQREHGVSLSECDVLENLARASEQSLAMSCVQALSTTSISGLSRAVARLEQKSYVVKTPSPTDRRAVQLTLTAAGAKLLPQLHTTLSALVQQYLIDCLPAAEITAFAKVNAHLAEQLKNPETKPQTR
ncbi:MarR family winged helix-turn-helix transcriptional regulator [Corynebacterium choanae]|uniref:DNA-binding transcriptional repressor MarR n=1 Tax=Corynebacterium choanae TaxID=1862358 RepID=A0A3G6J5C0_9CORY|nr:MarR family transcriptional regulator [Corynebacterium choanae]AZA12953.1 DNA-binding transcriptional repressor MarR [Corynebacterium choanae]